MILREELDHIINGGARTVGNQRAKIESYINDFGHTIKFLQYPDPERRFNCFSYALDAVDSKVINGILKEDAFRPKRYGVVFGTDFILQLIRKGILKLDPGGEIIIYLSNDKAVHGGKIKDNRVTSKWGTDCLWEHAIWEVPIMYGNTYSIFGKTVLTEVENEFNIYFENLRLLGFKNA